MAIFASHCHVNVKPVYPPTPVAKRQRVGKFRSFGKRLEHWRGEREIEAVVRRVKSMGLPFNAATLRGWEYGWTGQPDPIRATS
jgi:hypothetical protein